MKKTGNFMIGGGVSKNFTQNEMACAKIIGKNVPMHEYAVQITVADVRDRACSSTWEEASGWGKVDAAYEQMIYTEATTVLPLMVSHAYYNSLWKLGTKKDMVKNILNR